MPDIFDFSECYVNFFILRLLFIQKVVNFRMERFSQQQRSMIATAIALCTQIVDIINLINQLIQDDGDLLLDSRKRKRDSGTSHDRQVIRQLNFRRMVFDSDLTCLENIRMDRNCFYKLCNMLQTIGRLAPTKNMNVEEMVAIFLYIISHHAKNRILKREFVRSGETVSRQFTVVLNSILRLHSVLLKNPEHVDENCNDPRWKWFKVIYQFAKVFTSIVNK